MPVWVSGESVSGREDVWCKYAKVGVAGVRGSNEQINGLLHENHI